PSPTPSITGPEKSWAGEPPQKPSPNSYAQHNKPLLHRLLEYGQFRSKRVVRLLKNNGLHGSMGRVGSSSDNAAMESFFSLLQKNVLNTRRWNTREELRLAIVVWIETKYNRRRRQRPLGKLTPVEFETIYTTANAA
ncbi:transposase, partial [Subtercola boreus]|uniref:transposase n=1 Tax=Subtercola boreus TaxID=120213 RepID=UPI003F5ABC6D